MIRARLLLVASLAAIMAALCAPAAMRAFWSWREDNPIRRGARIAARAGCLACHGPAGSAGLPDPNGGNVPTWDGGVPMMYVNGVSEIREYIEDGVSKRRAKSDSARAERDRAAIRMPAYRELLTSRDIDDVARYVAAVARLATPADPAAARGRDLVGRHRCEACHGIEGSGGVANPGSFKGYVPGWLGADFADLVHGDAELRSWIRDGGIERFARDRLAVRFLTRQRLQMPAYGKALSSDDTEAIMTYVKSLRGRG